MVSQSCDAQEIDGGLPVPESADDNRSQVGVRKENGFQADLSTFACRYFFTFSTSSGGFCFRASSHRFSAFAR